MIDFPKTEEKILKFWKEKKIFEKSLKKTKKGKRFVFFEGPPFANGLPGIHHLLSRAFKDVILRYKTMQGFFVERKAGWDTHGLPTEMEAEKKLGIKSKKDIEKIGIKKFIETCQNSVFTYKKEWEEFTERIGFWLDLKNAYITCSNGYIESLWWILKKVWQKGLLYQDYKVVPYCPRCGTSLSSHEVAQGYKKITEESITVKFELADEPGIYILVWTTTPWTLPGNVALAVNPAIVYVKFSLKNYPGISDGIYITSKKDFDNYKKEIEKAKSKKGAGVEILEQTKGKDLIGKKYKPLYPNRAPYKIIGADFVSNKEGTGVVHIAPAFGEDDMKAGKENNLPVLTTVDEQGRMLTKDYPWNGKFIKEADPLITQDLKNRDLIFHTEDYEHDYPFCWRCDSPLLYYAKTSWFIKMSSLRKKLLENNKKINWIPNYLKAGRFGEWLREIKDWNLSRERFWGTPLPIWKCQIGKSQKSKVKSQKYCDNIKVIESIKELEKLSGKKIKDLHRPYIDEITFKCEKCGGQMKRIPEVADCWFDSGSMPYAQWHYPFDPDIISSQSSDNYVARNKELSIPLPKNFPADFICEGIDQTRGWFYTLLAVSTLLELEPAYKNVISHGIVLDAKAQKMSKSKGNIVLPKDVIDKWGADCARFYFYTINSVGEPKRFDIKDVQEISRRFFGTLWNCWIFFSTYTPLEINGFQQKRRENKPLTGYSDKSFKPKKGFESKSLLDCWIISRFHNLCKQVIEDLDRYYVVEAARLFEDFVDDLSNWYIRRSRRRFQKSENNKEKEGACQTLYYVLLNLSKLIAPFTPFISEEIYQGLKTKDSVHLCDYPKPNKKLINKELEERMKQVREIVTIGLAHRSEAGIKVRQPLSMLKIPMAKSQIPNEMLELIKEEVNVKKIIGGKKIELNTKITPKLKEEGIIREVIRNIQTMRKRAGYIPKDRILVQVSCNPDLEKIIKKNKNLILKETRADKFEFGKKSKQKPAIEQEFKIDQQKLWIAIKKIK